MGSDRTGKLCRDYGAGKAADCPSKEPAARSMEITFENNNSSDRVVEYVKTGAEGSRLRVVLNASGKETDVETEGSVLFARGYENGVLRAGGALVERL